MGTRWRHTPEQIIRKPQEGEELIGQGGARVPAVRDTRRWRAGFLSMRLALASILLLFVLAGLARLSGAAGFGVAIKALLPVVVISIVIGWLSTILLFRQTQNSAKLSDRDVDILESFDLMRYFLSDMFNFKKW